MKKQIVVIGLGKFGTSVATELYQLGHDVLAIDLKDKNVQDMLGHVTYSVKVDATNETVLDDLGIRNFDVAVVSIGSDIQSSILVTVLLQSLGVPFIIARASDELHGNTLKRIGAHRVVFPENQTGKDIAHTLFNPNVMDYMDITSSYSIARLRAPENLINQTLEEAGLAGPRDKYLILVLSVSHGREVILQPASDKKIEPGDVLIVGGDSNALSKLYEETSLTKKTEKTNKQSTEIVKESL